MQYVLQCPSTVCLFGRRWFVLLFFFPLIIVIIAIIIVIMLSLIRFLLLVQNQDLRCAAAHYC